MSRARSAIEHATDKIIDTCINLDPDDTITRRRAGDGRSVWIEPVAGQYTSGVIVGQEEHILTWALDRHSDLPSPSPTVDTIELDVMQAVAAGAVAGHDPLVLVEGPAGAGKTTMLQRAANDLTQDGRRVFGVAPTAKAARVLETETLIPTDTLAKLLHEYARTDRQPEPRYRLPAGATLIVDEAGMISTPRIAPTRSLGG